MYESECDCNCVFKYVDLSIVLECLVSLIVIRNRFLIFQDIYTYKNRFYRVRACINVRLFNDVLMCG